MAGLMAFGLFAAVGLALMAGFPVAFTLAGVALIFAGAGMMTGTFDPVFLEAFPNRIYGIMTNETLIAVPVFVFMGVMLERSKLADQLLQSLAQLMRGTPGGLGIAVVIVGAMMAASTGIVGATVVTMGLISLPTMLRKGYSPEISTGTICAAGTLGQIIPPSIVLVMLADVLSNAYQQAQLRMGNYSPETVSVGELFAGALVPGLILVAAYLLYIVILARARPGLMPPDDSQGDERVSIRRLLVLAAGPLALIIAVLGSILKGIATPTEAAAVGAVGAMLLAIISGHLSLKTLTDVVYRTTRITAMVFMILIGASLFSLVFRGFGGDEMIADFLTALPGGVVTAMVAGYAGHVPAGLRTRFHRDHVRGSTDCRSGVDGHGPEPDLAGCDDRPEPADFFSHAALWLLVVLPARCLSGFGPDFGHLPRRHSFYRHPGTGVGLLALWPQLVTWLPGIVYPG